MGDQGSEETRTTTEPWGPQGEQLRRYYSEAADRYGTPIEYFPQSTVGQRNRNSLFAEEATASLGASDYRQSGQKYLGQVLGGDFMGEGGNPHLDDTFDALSSRVTERFNRSVMPGINSRFARAGRSGSSAHGLSAGAAQGELADSLGELGSQIYYGDYENRMDDRMEALGLLPTVQGLEYADIGQQRQQGAIEENYTQRLLDDSISRFNFAQTEPEERLDRFGTRVGQNLGFGTRTGTAQSSGGGGAAAGLGAASLITTLLGTALGGPPGGAAAQGFNSLLWA